MIRIEHVAVWTHDLERLSEFYRRHFGAMAGEPYRNAPRGFTSRFLTFGHGARLELMRRDSLPPDGPREERPGLAHLALVVGTEAEVDALTARLREAGVTVASAPRRTGDGYYESVVLDPDGNRIELAARFRSVAGRAPGP